MRICLLCEQYPPDMGGLAQAAVRHARTLVEAGHAVHVCVPSADVLPETLRTEVQEGIVVHRMGSNTRGQDTLADWCERMVDLDSQVDFDLFHGYFVAYGGFVAAYLGRHCHKRSVVSARGNDIDQFAFDAARAPFVLKALEWADALTAVSHDLAHKVRTLSGREDVVVIPNSVDSELFAPRAANEALRERLGLDENLILGFVGEARAKKGLAMLLRAFARVNTQVPVHLLFVGGVRAQDQPVMDLFRSTYPYLSIRQIPYQPHHMLPAYYALMDLVLFPSLRAGLPNALLEAMACERAVIASSVGGIVDVVDHGQDGWLIPPRDEEALVEGVLALGRDGKARARLGKAARAKMCARYTPSVELAHNMAVYRSLLGERVDGLGVVG